MKICRTCNIEKDFPCFTKHKGRKDGHLEICKDCRKLSRKDKTSPEVNRAKYLKNKERYLAKQKEYHLANREERCAKMKEYNQRTEYSKNHYAANKEIVDAKWKTYYEKNKKVLQAKNLQYRKERLKVDPGYRILNSCRRRLRRALKGERKLYNFMKNVGCSADQLKSYLESQFQPGMTWQNYSNRGWHIDHIKPLSKFDLTKEDQFHQAIHYTNLQPLWAGDNLKKSNKLVCANLSPGGDLSEALTLY